MTDDRNDAALRALAADVEDLGRRLRQVEKTAAQAADDAGQARRAVVDVANMVTSRLATTSGSPAAAGGSAGERVPWLAADDIDAARRDVADLIGWLRDVYLHYDDATLPDCWLWHPGIVAELMALRDVWAAAHYGDQASPQRVMDWHDGYRPRTVRRVRELLTGCSLDRHAPGGDREYRPTRVPGVDMSGELVAWWVQTHGSSAAPSPSAALLAESRAHLGGRAGW